jgi:hypothetical protein
MGSGVYQLLRPLKYLIPEEIAQRASARAMESIEADLWKDVDMRDLIMAWASLVILQNLVYYTAFLLIFFALAAVFDQHIALVLTMYPAVQRDTIDFLLTPSPNMFDVLVPAIFLYTLAKLWSTKRSGVIAAFVVGISMLGKNIVFPFCNWLYEYLFVRPWRKSWKTALLAGILFVAPTLAYQCLLLLLKIPFYNHEIQAARQFIWIWDFISDGRAAYIPLELLRVLGKHLLQFGEGWMIPLVFCATLACLKDKKTFVLPPNMKRHLIVYVVCAAVFWVTAHNISSRYVFYYFPAVVVLMGVLATRKLARPVPWLVFGIIAILAEIAITNSLGIYTYTG